MYRHRSIDIDLHMIYEADIQYSHIYVNFFITLVSVRLDFEAWDSSQTLSSSLFISGICTI